MGRITLVDYSNFIHKPTIKKQIVLHHTVSYGSAWNVIRYWKSRKYRIGTHFIIDRQGRIFQLFNTKYWSGHIGRVNREREKLGIDTTESPSQYSIGIELISAGGLIYAGSGVYINAYHNQHTGDVRELDKEFRGFKFFEPYTSKQIESLEWLLKLLMKKWKIGFSVNSVEEIFDVNEKALRGEYGVFAHVSYRLDKSDVFPQAELVSMLKRVKQWAEDQKIMQ